MKLTYIAQRTENINDQKVRTHITAFLSVT